MEKSTGINGVIKIVLADDDSDDRDLFNEAMELANPVIKVEMVQDGEELMEYLNRNSSPDYIFLDLNMPRKSGKECLIEIQENIKLKDIPVIIYTTSLNPKDVEACSKGGASHFMRKPNSFQELKIILHKFFQQTKGHNGLNIRDQFILNGNH